MKWFLMDRLLFATQRVSVALIICLILRQFTPEWWQVHLFIEAPLPSVWEMLLATAQAEQLYRWWTVLLLSGCCGFVAFLRAQLPWPSVNHQQVLIRAK